MNFLDHIILYFKISRCYGIYSRFLNLLLIINRQQFAQQTPDISRLAPRLQILPYSKDRTLGKKTPARCPIPCHPEAPVRARSSFIQVCAEYGHRELEVIDLVFIVLLSFSSFESVCVCALYACACVLCVCLCIV